MENNVLSIMPVDLASFVEIKNDCPGSTYKKMRRMVRNKIRNYLNEHQISFYRQINSETGQLGMVLMVNDVNSSSMSLTPEMLKTLLTSIIFPEQETFA